MKKIKIVFIHTMLVQGGAEKALYYLVKLLDKTKFDITVLTIYSGGELEDAFKNLGVKMRTLYSCSKRRKTFLEKAVNYINVREKNALLRLNSKRLLKFVTGETYDIVVSYHIGNHHYCLGMPNRGKTIKYIHSDVLSFPKYLQGNEYIRRLNKKYDKIICVSELARRSFEKEFGERNNITSLINPLDTEEILRLSCIESSFEINEPYIFALGRFSKEKGFDRLLRVYRKLRDNSFMPLLVISGDGREKDNLSRLAKQLGIGNYVYFTGFLSNPYSLMKNSRFVVVPSYSEGLSMVTMEALCLGVPVVSTCESVSELFGDQCCGIITENSDNALFTGISLMNGEIYETSKISAQKRSKEISGKELVKFVEEEYERLVSP